MLVKTYKSYIPTVDETYHQIKSTTALVQIYNIAAKYNLDNLIRITKQELDWRKNPKTQHIINAISMCKVLQKDPNKIAALGELLACAIEHRITLFALCVQAALISFGYKDTAKETFKKEFEKDNSFILSEFGMELLVNLYRDPSDNLLEIENYALRRFLAEQA